VKDLKAEIIEDLTVEEESERLRLERKVEKAFYEAGVALQTLRDRRLYRSTHSTFEEYCRERFDYSRSYSSRLIKAVEVVDNIRQNVANWQQNKTIVLPATESQCRHIAKLKQPSSQARAWIESVNKCDGSNPPTKVIEKVVEEIKPKKPRKSPRTTVAQNNDETRPKTEYKSIDNAQINQNVRVKPYHSLFPLQSGVIVQIPNNRSAIVELENNSRELIDIKDLEIQVLVESNGSVTTTVEVPNRILGAGLDWYVRVDEATFKALDSYAKENGIPTLGLAVQRLLANVTD
jgi:hypothetical protein